MCARVTFTAHKEHHEIIDDLQERPDIDSQSDALRFALSQVREEQTQHEELQKRIESLEVALQEARDEKAEAVEELREEKEEAVEEVREEYETDLRVKEARITELTNKLANINTKIEHQNEVIGYVREEKSLVNKKAQAGLLTRAKWWVTGVPAEEM